jgi:serine/threonine protein kinase
VDRKDLLPQAAFRSTQQVVADRYTLERSLGNGGMGEVFVATDRTLGRRVALKQLAPALAEDEAARGRFFREARALARVSDSNVVGVFDVGDDEGRPFLVMELIQGTTVSRELEKLGRLPIDRALAIGAGVAGGLAAAHAKGVIHRDVKPSNIFLTGDDEAKVGDFGIARVERGEMTVTITGETFGSPAYIAPEQAMSGRVGPAADLYALGCVLYHMIAGRLPFEGDAVAQSYQHVHEAPAPLDQLEPNVPPGVAALVGELFQKDPEARPRSAADVQRALQSQRGSAGATVPVDATALLPVATQPLPEQKRGWPWPIVGIAGAAILLIAVMAFAFARWGGQAHPPRRSAASQPASSPQATSPPATPSISVQTVRPSTPQGAATALLALAGAMEASGALDKHLADEVQHAAVDALDHLDEPDEVRSHLEDLQGKLSDEADKGKIAPEDAQQLSAAIGGFIATLSSGESEGD